MGTTTIDLPKEVGKILEDNPDLKENLVENFINKIARSHIEKGVISKELLNIVVEIEDVDIKEEKKILKELRNKAKERLHDN
ncbi:MAG: hypothetical protein ACOCTR_01065 [Candidatus Natronoplasma sp.]